MFFLILLLKFSLEFKFYLEKDETAWNKIVS